MTEPSSPARPTRARRRVLLGAAAGAVLVVVTVGLVLTGSGSGGGDSATAAPPTGVPVPTETVVPDPSVVPPPPTPEPTGPTSDANAAPASLPAVPLDDSAAVGNGITAVVESLEAVDGTATGPGNVAGPALRATVRITNGTAEPVSLDAVAVDLASGADQTPASPLDDPSGAPFSGTVAPGDSAVGVYVFTVPVDARTSVTVSVGYQAGAPFLVFTGSAA